MSWIKVLCIFLGLMKFDITLADESNSLEVNLSLGKVKGSLLTTRLGRKIFSFRGIRYAEPPVGERRFQVYIYFKKNK